MQSIFLSYTYDPDPAFKPDTDDLKRSVSMIVESMELRPITGEDLGGQNVSAKVRLLIEKCDAFISILTPHRTGSSPPWVTDEFAYAQAKAKPSIRVIHESLQHAAAGMFAQEEYIPYSPAKALEGIMKVMRTVALWKRDLGRPAELELGPNQLARQYDAERDRCEYRLFLPDQTYSEWQRAVTRREPGGTYAHIPGLPEAAKVALRMSVNGQQWESDFHRPVGRIELAQR